MLRPQHASSVGDMPELLIAPSETRHRAGDVRRKTGTADRSRRPAGPALAYGALALIALYVVDDNALHAEPGTSLGDHLASMLIPLALLLAVALAHARVRAGLRAVLALTIGALAVTAGVADGFRHVAVDRVAGDDITSMLSGIAGAVLIVLGGIVLWRSRRLDERPLRRYPRRALVGALAALGAIFIVLPVGIAVVATHKARLPLPALDFGRPAQAVALRTSDGLRLAGSYVPSRNRAAVIVFPGRTGTVARARMLVRHGYGVLLIDRRGEGASEGDPNARGWGGEPDARAALAFVGRRPDVDRRRIGGPGLSVGGELLLQTAAHSRALRAVVSEGAGKRSMAEQLDWPGIPRWQRWLSPSLVETGAMAVLANTGPPERLTRLVPRIAPRPVLLIRATRGNGDEILNRAYFSAARAPKALWEVPSGGHVGALAAQPAEYERRVVGFFDRSLDPRR